MIDCLPICYVRCVYKFGARHHPWYQRFISPSPHYCAAAGFSIPSTTCHRCRETRLRSLCLLASLHGGRGVSGFWEAPSRLLAGCLLLTTPGVHWSLSTVFFFFFLRGDNPTVKMSILSLLFGFISFLLLALDPVNLIQIVVLVSIHISVIIFLLSELIYASLNCFYFQQELPSLDPSTTAKRWKTWCAVVLLITYVYEKSGVPL